MAFKHVIPHDTLFSATKFKQDIFLTFKDILKKNYSSNDQYQYCQPFWHIFFPLHKYSLCLKTVTMYFIYIKGSSSPNFLFAQALSWQLAALDIIKLQHHLSKMEVKKIKNNIITFEFIIDLKLNCWNLFPYIFCIWEMFKINN